MTHLNLPQGGNKYTFLTVSQPQWSTTTNNTISVPFPQPIKKSSPLSVQEEKEQKLNKVVKTSSIHADLQIHHKNREK